MRKIQSSLALIICSAFIGNASALENSLNNDANTDEPSQVEEKLTLNNPAQIQKVENLVNAIEDGLIEATEKAQQTIEISQLLVDDAQATLNQAQVDLESTDPADSDALLKAEQDVAQALDALTVAQSGLGKANQQLTTISEASPESITQMRESGMGWGEIAKALGVHPGLLGLGHNKRAAKKQNIASDTQPVINRKNSAVEKKQTKNNSKTKSNNSSQKSNNGNGGNGGGKGGKKK